MEALIKQVESTLSTQYGETISALEQRILMLEEKVQALEAQNGIQRTATPLATATPFGATAEPSATPTKTPNPSGYDCETTLQSPYYYGEFSPGSFFAFRVLISNTGTKTWQNNVTIKYMEGLQAEVDNLYAYALPVAAVEPGDSFIINIPMQAPTEKNNDGKYESTYVLKTADESFCEFSYSIYVP